MTSLAPITEPASLDCSCGCGWINRIDQGRTKRLAIVAMQFRV